MLSKSLSRFPAGTANRWETICNYLNAQLKPEIPFEKNEVMRAAQNAMQFISQKSGAVIPPTIAPKTKESQVSVTAEPKAKAVASTVSSTPVLAKPVTSARSTASVGHGKKIPETAPREVKASEWTQADQTLLEEGLRKNPAGKTPEAKAERWKVIAEGIPGKSANDCIARYKFLREQLKAKSASKS